MELAPARIAQPGTFQLPGFPGWSYTIGREATRTMAIAMLQRSPSFAVDIEGLGLGVDARTIKSVQLAQVYTDGTGRALVLDPRDLLQADTIRTVIHSASELIFHNSAFDAPNLYLNRLMRIEDMAKVRDTLIHARLAEPRERVSKSLGAAANRHLGLDLSDPLPAILKTLGWTKLRWYRDGDLNIPMYTRMAASDAILTAALAVPVRRDALRRLTEGHPFSVYGVTGDEAHRLVDREQRLNRLCLRRSARGLLVDTEYLDRFRAETETDQARREEMLTKLGIKPGNSTQFAGWLDERGMIPSGYPRTPAQRKPSGSKEDLKLLAGHDVVREFLAHKKIEHQLAYMTKTADLAAFDGRIHPQVNVLGAQSSGRQSVGDPPYQQFDAGSRGVIVPDEGDAFTSIDWSQIEPVYAANMSGDRQVLQEYEAGTNDLYTTLAVLIYGDAATKEHRQMAKKTLLAQLYGQGLELLARQLDLVKDGRPDLDRAKEIRNSVFRAMPRTAQWIQKLKAIAEDYQMVPTLSGRILPIPVGKHVRPDGKPAVAAHCGVNYPVQGSAYDLLAEAALAAEDAGLGDQIYMFMHDEMVVSTTAAPEFQRIMSTPPERLCRFIGRTPVLRAEMTNLGPRWGKEGVQ